MSKEAIGFSVLTFAVPAAIVVAMNWLPTVSPDWLVIRTDRGPEFGLGLSLLFTSAVIYTCVCFGLATLDRVQNSTKKDSGE